MLLVALLLMVTASALRPFEMKQGSYELVSLLTGILVFSAQLGNTGPISSKLVLNANIAVGGSTLLGLLVLGRSSLIVLHAWSEAIVSPVMLVVLISASTLVLTAQTSALVLTALELQSYAAYTIVALGSMPAYRQVAASTYLLVGALATASFVFGWAIIVHVGELALARLPAAGHGGQACQVAGLLAKLGCFPFGYWLPLAYGGIEWATLGIIAVVPQISLAVQVWELAPAWLAPVYLLSGASVALGRLMSASTPCLRTLLAFRGMAHVGYLLSGAALNLYPILLYSLVYTGVLSLLCLSLAGYALRPVIRLSGLRGGANVFALQAAALQIAALNLGGVPPLLGFFAKAYILLGGICLTNSLLHPLSLVVLGTLGMVAYLRITLISVGYPQTYNYLLQPGGEIRSSGPNAFLLGMVALPQLLSEELSLSLLY